MACSNPLVAFPPRYSGEGFDQRYKILGNLRHISSNYSAYLSVFDGCIQEPVLLPCGKCLGCRLDYANKWSTRIYLETLTSDPDSCFFVTLTYSDINLPFKGNVPTLNKVDFQKFVKRLRIKFPDSNIRYFCGAEYGEQSFRPHYHVCFFNLPLTDLVFYKSNFNGDILYTSELISDVWSLGHVVVAPLDVGSAAYTARYTSKKVNGSVDSFVEENDLEPERAYMSRRPGIGVKWFEEHQDCIKDDKIYLPDGRVASVPRLFLDHCSDNISVAKLKSKRSDVCKLVNDSSVHWSSKDYRKILQDKERQLRNKVKSLERD